MKTFSSFSPLFVIVLHNSDVLTVNDVNIADSLEALFVPLLKKTMRLQNWISSFTLHTFMSNFVYPFQIN